MLTKTFNTSTIKGLRSAERFKARLENAGMTVSTKPVGLDRVAISGKDPVPMRCDQCSASRINGVFCHERYCPNVLKEWDSEREQWVLYVQCPECGCDVEVGEFCDCSVCE